MTIEQFYEKASSALEHVNESEYPEIYDFLSSVKEMYWLQDLYEISSILYNCDKTKQLPAPVSKLLIEIYNDEIENKNHDAMCDLGSLYYTGRIGEQNYEKAVYYYDMAASLGNRQAQENLGYCYYYGRLGEIDYKKAFHYFVKGALDNHLISLYKIGDMYKNGYYVERDEQEAFCIYLHCFNGLNENNTPIMGADIYIRMADSYYNGMGTEKDLPLALQYYQVAEQLYLKRIIHEGDYLIKKQYERSIEMQAKIREELKSTLPNFDWID